MADKETEGEETKTDFEPTIKITVSMVESSKKKKLKKFEFVTEEGDHVHLTAEQIKEQKRIEESASIKPSCKLDIDFNKPLSEQNPILKLNDLARKKRKDADEIHGYFRSTKRTLSPLKTLEISQMI
ncbi:hypothetical protein Tco_1448072 [Tanacetum coccineum]